MVRWSPHRENACYYWSICTTLSSVGQCFSHPDCKRYSDEERNIQTVALRHTREKKSSSITNHMHDVGDTEMYKLTLRRRLCTISPQYSISQSEQMKTIITTFHSHVKQNETRKKESATEQLIWAVRQLRNLVQTIRSSTNRVRKHFRESSSPKSTRCMLGSWGPEDTSQLLKPPQGRSRGLHTGICVLSCSAMSDSLQPRGL